MIPGWGTKVPLATLRDQKQTKGTCTFVFIAALCTIAKMWKQPKCPLTEERMKMWRARMCTHTDTRILISRKKEKNSVICSNVDGTRDYHTKWRTKTNTI